jgi:hypothetical protein
MDRALYMGICTLDQRNHNGKNPQTAQDAIEFSAALTDEALRSGTFGKVIPLEKRKWNNNKIGQGAGRNGNSFKKPAKAIRTFAATQPQAPVQQPAGKIGYAGPNPKCDRCHLHHVGPCVPCQKCGRTAHLEKFRKNGQTGCYECGATSGAIVPGSSEPPQLIRFEEEPLP